MKHIIFLVLCILLRPALAETTIVDFEGTIEVIGYNPQNGLPNEILTQNNEFSSPGGLQLIEDGSNTWFAGCNGCALNIYPGTGPLNLESLDIAVASTPPEGGNLYIRGYFSDPDMSVEAYIPASTDWTTYTFDDSWRGLRYAQIQRNFPPYASILIDNVVIMGALSVDIDLKPNDPANVVSSDGP